MLDRRGIIEVFKHTQARHIDAARNLLYHNLARSIGLCVLEHPHSAVERAFYVSSEDMMRKTNKVCDRCGKPYYASPCELNRSHYCSRACQFDFETQFWSHVDKSGDCWIWTSVRDARGYGVFQRRINGKAKRLRAHRIAYELAYGTPLGDLFACHTCDNPSCVRPDHLFAGTDLDNTLDMMAKGRHNSIVKPECQVRGEQAWNAKLTEDQVRTMRAEYAAGLTSQRALARRYGIALHTAKAIIRRKMWKHVL